MSQTIQAVRMVETKDMDRDTWLKARKSGIGGSDSAVVAGVSPWKGPYEAFKEKTNQYEPKFAPEQLERMEFGNIMEPLISDLFAKKNPSLKIERRNCIYQHPITSFMLCNLDRVIYDAERGSWGILECKNVGEWAYKLGDWNEAQIPFYYMIQMQHMMYVTDLEWGYFGYLIGGNRFGQQYVERDEEIIFDLVNACSKFWNLVESGVEPPADALCGHVLCEEFPAKEDHAIDLSFDKDILTEYRLAQDQYEAAKETLEVKKNQIIRKLEGAEIGLLGDKKVISFKPQTRSSIDTTLLKKEMPEIASKYTKTTITKPVFKPNFKGVEL